MTSAFRVIALIAAHNEADIIAACLTHLRDQGIESYLIDDGSTDGTAAIAGAFRGKGLLDIETLAPLDPPRFSLERLMARKEALAAGLDAAWFINQDADEFRDSLWAETDLRAAFERVDQLGWNAIDFEIFTIPPVGSRGEACATPDGMPAWYTRARQFDRLQVRAWKRQPQIDLRSTGGHDVQFPGRRVFPLRFPLRHYPIRSQAHGERKLFADRRPRFDPSERERDWHIQYDGRQPGDVLAPSERDVLPYDPGVARMLGSLSNRELELSNRELAAAQDRIAALERAIDALDEQVQARVRAIESMRTALDASHAGAESLQRELQAVYHSRTWRWTAPFRWLLARVGIR